MLHLSRQLAEIKCDVPVECPLDLAQFTMNREKVLEKFTEIEFRGLHRFLDIKGICINKAPGLAWSFFMHTSKNAARGSHPNII